MPHKSKSEKHNDGMGLQLLPDTPIDSPNSDRLDRMSFVRSFAQAVRAVQGKDSVVLALAGPWGSGKSSLLNLVDQELSGDEVPPLVVRFNPWWFTRTGRLITAFLEQLGAAASRPECVEYLGVATEWLSQLAASIETPGRGEAGFDAGARDIERLREKLNGVFSRCPRRVLVFMDDVDRLLPEEMTQLLLIVRAVADFPQITYVLTFDHDVVSQAISNRLGVDGRTYLEKVVLLQIDVPMPGRMALERMVMGQLEAIDSKAAQLDADSQRHFRIMFEGGVRHFLRTPRACTRMLNVIRFTYPLLVGQVYFPDLLGIACLISFSSQAIQAIRTNPDAFVGPCDPTGDGWVRLREHHSAWLSEIQERDRSYVEVLVRGLFPKVAWALNGPLRGEEHAEEWSERKRVCSINHFDSYFRLGISQGEATERRWRTMVELLDDATAFARALDRYGPLGDGESPSVDNLLQQASDYVIEQATSEQAASLFRAILARGDTIAAISNGESSRRIDHMHRLVSLLSECLTQIGDPSERLQRLTDAVRDDAGLLTSAELLDSLDFRPRIFCPPQHEPDAERHRQCLLSVLKLLDQRMQAAAESGELSEHPFFLRVLHKWWKFGRKAKAQKWTRALTELDANFVDAVMQARPLSELEAATLSHSANGASLALPLEFLQDVFGKEELSSRVSRLVRNRPDWMSDEASSFLFDLFDLIDLDKN